MKKIYKGLPVFTDTGRKYFDEMMITLGQKTKSEFVEKINKEDEETKNINHQYFTAGDVRRVALLMGLDVEKIDKII